MSEETDAKAEEKRIAVQAYYEAKTKEERAAIVKQFPVLREIFSDSNHS